MDYKEIRQKLKEIGLTAQHMGTYAQDGQCIIYDDETDSEIETDVMGLLKANFGNVTIAETSHFHDGYGIYSFHDHNVHIHPIFHPMIQLNGEKLLQSKKW